MKILPLLILSLFYSSVFANTDIDQNTINAPSIEKTIPTAKRQADASLEKKNEVKKIASSVKRDFENKVKRVWQVPANSSGQRATAHVTLNDSGSVATVSVSASDPDIKESIIRAIHRAAPYPMPSDPDARRELRSFSAGFTVK